MDLATKIAAYRDQLISLQPPGAAWTTEPGSTRWNMLTALAVEFARIDMRAAELREEADPRTTVEMLPDWERVAGLPDPCAGQAQTLAERRQRLVAKLAARGGQSIAYFVGIAAQLGYTVTIEEFRVFTCVSRCIDALNPPPWQYAWRVRAPANTVRTMTCASACDEPLRSWGNRILECVIGRLKPGQTHVIFAYGAPT
ncbi:MAG: YmfQ family protein [Rhodospirillales bacterium]|jgi:uncharacterized protein YmfQ (DUF2313 family)